MLRASSQLAKPPRMLLSRDKKLFSVISTPFNTKLEIIEPLEEFEETEA
jgi:hypothetical protein